MCVGTHDTNPHTVHMPYSVLDGQSPCGSIRLPALNRHGCKSSLLLDIICVLPVARQLYLS